MATINLTNASTAAQVQPTTGTTPRQTIGAPALAAVLPVAGQLAAEVYEGNQKRNANLDEAAAATRALDLVIDSQNVSFQDDPVVDAATAAGAAVQSDLGVNLSPEQRNALTAAATLGKRVNDALASDPTAQRRFDILRTKELRTLITKHPEMAKEFRSLIFGSNSFITDLLSNQDTQAAQAAKVRSEALGRVRNTLIDAGYSQAADLPDDQIQSFADTTGYFRDVRRFQETTQRAQTLKAEYESGEVVDRQVVRDMTEAMLPGARRALMTGLDEITRNANLDEPTKQRAINDYVLERRAWLSEQFPMLGADEIETRFKDVLVTIPDLYRQRADSSLDRGAAENQLAIVKAGGELNLRQKYPDMDETSFVLDVYSQVAQALGPSWSLSNREQAMSVMQPLLDTIAANRSGATQPQLTPTRRTDQEIAEETQEQATFVSNMARQFQAATPETRTATAQMIVNGIEHPDNMRSDAGFDKWIALMASPQFEQVATSEEFQTVFADSDAHRFFENYLGNLDTAVVRAMDGLEGKVEVNLDEEGYFVFNPTATLTPQQRDSLIRVSNRLRNVTKAQVNLYGISPREASQAFWQEYLAQ